MSSRFVLSSLFKRLFAFVIAITFFLFAVMFRLFFVQVVSSKELSKKAVAEWFRDLPLSALRGSIVDRNGIVLASSYITYDVYVRPASVKNKNEMVQMLAKVISLDEEEVKTKISKNVSEVKVASGISFEQASLLTKNYLSGIYLTENSAREYSFSGLLSSLLGFCNSDGDGQTGLELYYNQFLSGVDGKMVEQTDIKGRAVESGTTYFISSVSGCTLKTTIDYSLQVFVENLCKQAMVETGAGGVSCLVMNPQTGEVLAVGNQPSFDLTNFSRDDVASLLALSKQTYLADVYEPGSTFKILTGAVALELGLTSPSDYFYCGGFRVINGVKISCHRRTGHGSVSLSKGFSASCNCVFMDLVSRIGIDRFYEYMEKLHLTSGYGLDFKNEAKAILMTKKSAQSYDLARMGFGQAIALSPLQLLNSVNTAINGGTLFKPCFVKEIVSSSGKILKKNSAEKIEKVFSASTSKVLNQMLLDVVETGGGKNAQVAGVKVLGKTGTAQKYENGTIAQGKYVASFVGAFPADAPKYSVLFVVDEPQGAYYGSVVSAPYAQKVLQFLAEKENSFSQKEYEKAHSSPAIVMPDLTGLSLTEAVSILSGLNLQYLTQGDGEMVLNQLQPAGTLLSEGDIVLIYL